MFINNQKHAQFDLSLSKRVFDVISQAVENDTVYITVRIVFIFSGESAMPIVSDFTHIIGDQSIRIGDGSNESGFTDAFSTGGRDSNHNAFITFMIQGMTVTNEDADVFVNDVKVGVLFNSNGGNRNHWNTQTVSLSGSQLNNGNNVLRVSPVTNPRSATDDFDDFQIRNVICHFHQSA